MRQGRSTVPATIRRKNDAFGPDGVVLNREYYRANRSAPGLAERRSRAFRKLGWKRVATAVTNSSQPTAVGCKNVIQATPRAAQTGCDQRYRPSLRDHKKPSSAKRAHKQGGAKCRAAAAAVPKRGFNE
jgi:hypothetical protein